MTPTLTFTCSICSEPSQAICVYCTKDACGNHLCGRCRRCSDCCECEVHLDESFEHEHAAHVDEAPAAPDLSKLFAPEHPEDAPAPPVFPTE